MTKFLITALAAGLLMGLAFAGTDILNPKTAAAEVNRMNIDAQHKQAMYQLEERLSTARTEAEVQAIQREERLLEAKYSREIQALSQSLAHQDLAFRTLMAVATFIGGAFALSLFISTTIWAGSRALVRIQSASAKPELMKKAEPSMEMRIPNLGDREPYDPLYSEKIMFSKRLNERLEEIMAAREERKDAEVLAERMRFISDPAKMSKEDYWKHPLAD